VLLLDEPVSGLDRREAQAVGDFMRQLASAGKAVLLIEHDLNFVQSVADDIRQLVNGSLQTVG
jgi:ABC-type branched-subunit amino acid transport system ATPase component